MKIGIDISPIESEGQKQHKVRGVGSYLTHLKNSLEKYVSQNTYVYFTNEKPLKNTVDLVHYPYFDPFFLTLPTHKVHKTVVTVHDLTPLVFPKHFPAGIKGAIRWLAQREALKRTDAIITDSEASKNDIMRIGKIKKERIHVVYLAAGEEFKKISITKEQKHMIREKYNLPERFVLSVGDVTWNKNMPRFIEAMKNTDIPVVLVGKAITLQSYDHKNEWNKDLSLSQNLLKSASNIQTVGFVPTEDLILLYNLAEVFVMPSIYEGFGLPILEAMACGCPVVTTTGGSLAEVGGDAAFIVDPYSTASITKGVKLIYDSQSLQHEFTEKGYKQVCKFSWEKTARETAAVYEKLTQ